MQIIYSQAYLGNKPQLQSFRPCCHESANGFNTHFRLRSGVRGVPNMYRHSNVRIVSRSKPELAVRYCSGCGAEVKLVNTEDPPSDRPLLDRINNHANGNGR